MCPSDTTVGMNNDEHLYTDSRPIPLKTIRIWTGILWNTVEEDIERDKYTDRYLLILYHLVGVPSLDLTNQ